jgi:putative transposase
MPAFPKRKKIRLDHREYIRDGYYFITICTYDHAPLFGDIIDGFVQLNTAGIMIEKWWHKIFQKYTYIENADYIIMPDHLHGILYMNTGAHTGAPLQSIVQIIQWFKTRTTNAYILGVKSFAWKSFDKHVWQRSFYDHVIRYENELNKIREYIRTNPINSKAICKNQAQSNVIFERCSRPYHGGNDPLIST